jgi:uncharacterized protein (TIGR00369 family)
MTDTSGTDGSEHWRRYGWRPLGGAGAPLADVDGISYLQRQIADPTLAAPISRTLGWRLMEAEPGRVLLALPVLDHLMHGGGIVHGGVLTTLADSAMANAVMSRLKQGQGCVTTQLNVSFLQSVRGEGTMTCEGRVLRVGRRVAFAEATLRDQRGEVCLTASSSFAILALTADS